MPVRKQLDHFGVIRTAYDDVVTSGDVTRGLLGEPGMPYNLLLNRSVDFDPFFQALQFVYHGGRNMQEVLGLIQILWDRTEPAGYAPYIVTAEVPGKGTWYRVRMGSFPTKDAATRYLQDFKRETQAEAFVASTR